MNLMQRVTKLESLHGSGAPLELPDMLIVSVEKNHETGQLTETPFVLTIPGDPCRYMVADYEAWPDDVKARYDGR